GPNTAVFSIQNGVDNDHRIGRVLDPKAVMCGVAEIFSSVEAPGVIIHRSGGLAKITLGELDGVASPRVERLFKAFQHAGIEAVRSPDIRIALWEKFLGICANSGLSSLTRLPFGPILACPETKGLYRGTLEEVRDVAHASGIHLAADSIERRITHTGNLAPGLRSSMANDLNAGRRLELESLNGTVVRLGREHGVPTPYNFAIYAALKPYVNGAPELP
ncbi:MAG: 2-dehydropantoate 2-reductase, partial [Dehalococcoidia bacterium]|nr:2-dehydropantoate 2-reductase [Dehalococcoidia bacterium]